MKVYAFHLLNDYSGSPKVLMQLVKGWRSSGLDVTIVTCSGREGFLSNLENTKYIEYWYRWASNPFLRLINLTLSQVILFFKLLTIVRKQDIIYINTVLPFGAAFLGKAKRCRIIYHVHETSMKPQLLKSFLFGVMRWAASEVVYVSKYLSVHEPVTAQRIHILHNVIEDNFLQEARKLIRPVRMPKNILMVCSLKPYKGIDEFLVLSEVNPLLSFRLVVNAAEVDIARYVGGKKLTGNIAIFPVQTNLHPFYAWADIIVNLSRPDAWIETFGLTIIEGMAYGLPAIVPPVGGITEIVVDGDNGFCVDSRDIQTVSEKLNEICRPEVYEVMHSHASTRINRYRESFFLAKSLEILGRLQDGKRFHHLEKDI